MGSNNITTGKVLFANMYATEGDLISAATTMECLLMRQVQVTLSMVVVGLN